MNVFELVAKLTLDSSEYDRAMMAAKGTATKSGKGMVAAIEGAKKKIGVAALGMGAAIGAFGVSSVKTGMQFDASMSQVAATMGKTMKDMENEVGEVDLAWGHFSGNLRDYAKEMGAHTKFSATETADALNYMALAGYDTEKSMKMLPNVLNLAAAGNMDLATASDMVTDASSALGLTEAQTTAMIDQMAAAASKSNTSVEQLGSAMLTVGGTAKVLRGGTTELSTALGILADNGTKGAEGGTALRNILTSIQGAKFEKTFGAMGVEAYDAQGKLRSLKDIFGDMQVAMDGMTDEERTDIINKTFNARDLKNVNALLGTSAQRWDELGAAIDDSSGAAQKMADTQLDNLAGDITILKSAFEGLQISVSDKLQPAMRKLVQGLTWCIDHADTLGPIILGLASAFGTFAVAINIGGVLAKLKAGFTAVFALFAANPIALAIAAFVGLAVALVTLYKNNEEFRDKVNAVWSAVKDFVVGAVEGIKSFVTTAFETIKTIVTTVWDAIKSATQAAWAVIQLLIVNPIKAAVNIVTTIINVILVVLTNIFVSAVNVVISIWGKVKEYIIKPIQEAYASLVSALSPIVDAIREKFAEAIATVSEIWGTIKEAIAAPIRTAVSTVSSAVDQIKSAVSSRFNAIKGVASKAWNAVKDAMTKPIQTAYNKIKGWVDKLKGFFPLKVGKIFTNLRVPKINISGGSPPFGIGGKGTKPSISVSWNKKAMENPYMFTKATFFGAGEAGDEVLYGRKALMDDIAEATNGGGQNVQITNYITVEGAESPEDFANRLVRQMQLDMRMV